MCNMTTRNPGPGFQRVTHERPLIEQQIDAYRMQGKLAEPAICPQCNAVFHKGRWQWMPVPAAAHHQICPACHRQNDGYPAGYVSLSGAFFDAHREEILRVVHKHEQRERGEHPLKRIMAIEQQGDATLVTTTDIHLARGIAEAVHHAYQGELELHYNPRENQLRAYWQR
jgi:NMD protein affecting ribosome stability and mRNA decay